MSNALIEIFRSEATRLGAEFELASSLGEGTSAEVADHRENALRSLVRRFFPAPHHVTKGQIIAIDATRSQSIDCIVLSPAHPHLVDREEKFSMILADGVDLAIEAKGRLDGPELTRYLNQSRSVKKTIRSKTPLLREQSRSKEELIGSQRIPTFAYCHESALRPETIAERVADWVSDNAVPWHERPDVIAIHDKGILLDTSSPTSVGGQILATDGRPGLYWVDTAELTLGQTLACMSFGIPAVAPLSEPMIRRYATLPDKAQLLVSY